MHLGWEWYAQLLTPCCMQWVLSWFVAWSFSDRCIGLTHSFLWQRWLTSRIVPGNCDLVRRISTIRATRCTLSTLLSLIWPWNSHKPITLSSTLLSIWHNPPTPHPFTLCFLFISQIVKYVLSIMDSVIAFFYRVTWHVKNWVSKGKSLPIIFPI